MKVFILISILFFQHSFFAQDSTLSIKIAESKVAKQKNSDTLNVNLNTNKAFSINQKPNQNLRFVLIQKESSFDFLKYIIPIFTLVLGIFLNKLLDKYNNKQKTKKSGERWIAELRSLEQPIREQIKRLEELIADLDTNIFNIPILSSYSILNGEPFKSLDKNEFLKYIESRHRKLEFKELVIISNRIHGYVNIISSLHQTMLDKYKEFNDQTSIHTNSLSKSLQSFNRAFADYGVELEKEIKGNPLNDPRYQPIADLYIKHIIPYLQNSNFNPYELGENFFKPLVVILSNYRLDDKTKILTIPMASCLNDIKAIKLEKEYMLANAKKIIIFFNDEVSRLEELIKEI